MSKLKFQGKTLYTKTCVNNILKMMKQSNEADASWYGTAYRWAHNFGDEHNISPIKVCGIIAALSPQKSWEENLRITQTFITEGKSYHTKAMTAKAKAIIELPDWALSNPTEICNILNGSKITSFFLNIYDFNLSGAVTIDRHAVEIAVGKKLSDHRMTANQYLFFENCYKVASLNSRFLPHQIQAMTWETWRVLKKTL
jgi:hypothetical protein